MFWPIKRNPEFFVSMYIVGIVSAMCTVVVSARQELYQYAWWETFLGVYLTCVVLAAFPLRIRRILRGIIYAVVYPLSIIDVYCYVQFDSPINPSILMLVGETDTREAGEFLTAYLSPDLLGTYIGLMLLILLLHIAYTVIRWRWKTKRSVFQMLGYDTTGAGFRMTEGAVYAALWVVLGFSVYYSLPNYRNMLKLFSYDTIGDVEHRLTEKDRGEQFLPLYRTAFSIYSNRLAAKQIDVLYEVAKTVKVDSCSFTSPDIVLIIGEAYNKYHSQLYGYERPTTPYQLQMQADGDLVSFDDVVSPWNLTSYVFKHIMSTYTVGDKGDWCDYPLFCEVFRNAGYSVMFLTNEFLPKAKQAVYDFSGGFFLNNPELSKAQFDIRNKDLHVFDEALLTDYHDLLDEHPDYMDKKGRLTIFHLIGQHQAYRIRCPKRKMKFTPEDYADRTDLTKPEWKKNLCYYDNATMYNDSIVWAITQEFKDRDAIVIYMPDHGEEVHSKELPHFSGRMHSTKIIKRLAREEFGIPFWIYATKSYQEHHPEIWQQVQSAHSKRYMTDALPHLLMYLGGINCKYYRPSLNILSPEYNENRPRIIKHQVDYDEVVVP